MALGSGEKLTGTKNTSGLGKYYSDDPENYTFDSPDFTFGATGQDDDFMDFTFDPITTPGNEDVHAAMQAIQSPKWLENMLMPGSVDDPLYIVLARPLLTPPQVLLAGGSVDSGPQGRPRFAVALENVRA
jgi:hypothetical protein